MLKKSSRGLHNDTGDNEQLPSAFGIRHLLK